MKFAKELEQNAVPEWRGKYLDYKGGKKKLKAVSRAMRNVDKSSKDTKSKTDTGSQFSSLRDAPVRSFLAGERRQNVKPGPKRTLSDSGRNTDQQPQSTQPIPVNDRSPLKGGGEGNNSSSGPRMTRYGSIIGSPPNDGEDDSAAPRGAPSLHLPEAALDESAETEEQTATLETGYERPGSPDQPAPTHPPSTQLAHRGNAYEVTEPVDNPSWGMTLGKKNSNISYRKRANSTLSGPLMKRVFSTADPPTPGSNNDVALEAYREVDFRKQEFFLFLDKELLKIETFYAEKEEEATERMKVIREQLHIMRNRRLDEIVAAERRKDLASATGSNATNGGKLKEGEERPSTPRRRHIPFGTGVDYATGAFGKVRPGHVGKTSHAMEELGTPSFHGVNNDYERRPVTKEVNYRTAKRKLKVALAEYYRSLELLKSYALLNRTAFRKINKKYDKTVMARPAGRYMNEKINNAHFVSSDNIEKHIQAVEDLYARYFERGSHKIAVGKLRAKIAGAGAHAGSTFRTGFLMAAGGVFAIQGLVHGLNQDLNGPDPVQSRIASYLLQIYAGYFLMLFLVFLFCLDAAVFSAARVNYQFIFEFDTRHMLDWKQLSEIPAYFFFLLGIVMWCNFSKFGGETMYIYWPVVLIGLSALLLFAPPPLFFAKSRGWFLYSNWRLAFAGYYPVEFRDFFLGDMFCSLTYALGNIELFFCLYAHHWNNPPQCNSSSSRLLGFFTTLPGIWRLFQCLRRYYDTRDVFPHLVNGGKYSFTILYYVSLSLYRMNHTTGFKSFFIVAAALNAIYVTVWDLMMDWSFSLDPYAKQPLLRSSRGYKQTWFYYTALVVDPIIRFNWIFYAIFTEDTQHSTICSFFVAFTEVLRRGMWVLLRTENEHQSNVGRFRAHRNVELPYKLAEEDDSQPEDSTTATEANSPDAPRPASGVDVEQGTPASLRRRKTAQTPYETLKRVGSTMAAAHTRDYEKKRPKNAEAADQAEQEDSEDEDEEDEDDDDL